MKKEIYEALKVIADECNKNPLDCSRCTFECESDSSSCLLKIYNPSSLFTHISKKEVYEFDDQIKL